MAAQSTRASLKQLAMSPHIRCAVGAQLDEGKLLSSPVTVDVARMDGGCLLHPSTPPWRCGKSGSLLAQQDRVTRGEAPET